MQIIGAGWGRTGTSSMKVAIEQLGFGPCLHMRDIFANPELAELWNRYERAEYVDWCQELSEWEATVDWPGCTIWPELAKLWPDAFVLLTVRDPATWYESVMATIHPRTAPGTEVATPDVTEMIQKTVWRDFGGWEVALDRDAAIAAFNAHNEEVRALCPPERLLEWTTADGWEPLCERLGVAVPTEPFPHLNDRVVFAEIEI